MLNSRVAQRTASGVRPAMRPTLKVDVLSLIKTDPDEEPPTARRPDLAEGLARVMRAYPEFKRGRAATGRRTT